MSVGFLAKRLDGVEASATLALAAKAKALKQSGKDVLDFTAGEPDFPTPSYIKRSGIEAVEKNLTRYTPVSGIPDLRAAVAKSFNGKLGTSYKSSQIIVSCGAKHSLYNALQATCQEGDEVIFFSPFWVSYLPLVMLTGAKPVVVPTKEEDNFQPDIKTLLSYITQKTKAIIINSPSNPTGMLIEKNRLKEIADVALKDKLLVISDEIYDELVYPPHAMCSIIQVAPSLVEQAIVVNGVSKSYCMTGWRIGYLAAPDKIATAIDALQSHSTSNPTSISQYAALAALTGSSQDMPAMVSEFKRRRDVLVGGLNSLSGLSCLMPQGAFYVWCNISQLKMTASEVAARWLDEALIAVVPGEGFGSSCHLRFSFATSLSSIEQALERLKQWLGKRI